MASVPVIDVASLISWRAEGFPVPPPTAVSITIQKIDAALRDIGFMYLTGHGVTSEVVTDLTDNAMQFFSLPEENKKVISMPMGGLAWRGWFPMGGELTSGRPDRKEGLYLGREGIADGRPLHGPNQFLPQPEGLPRAVASYMSCLEVVCETLMSAIAVALSLPREYFRQRFTEEPMVLFRLFNYAPNIWRQEEDEWGVREHTDYGFLTVLLQDDSGGLQVRARDGTWVEAPPIPDTFVVNIGDMLELWTHGYYRATPHRVRNGSGTKNRFSAPFFYDPGWEAKLDPIPRALLEAKLQGVAQLGVNERWDGADLLRDTVQKYVRYGDFLWMKVGKVFPDLAQKVSHAANHVLCSFPPMPPKTTT